MQRSFSINCSESVRAVQGTTSCFSAVFCFFWLFSSCVLFFGLFFSWLFAKQAGNHPAVLVFAEISCNLYNPGGDFTGYWGPFVKGPVKAGNVTFDKAAFSIMTQEQRWKTQRWFWRQVLVHGLLFKRNLNLYNMCRVLWGFWHVLTLSHFWWSRVPKLVTMNTSRRRTCPALKVWMAFLASPSGAPGSNKFSEWSSSCFFLFCRNSGSNYTCVFGVEWMVLVMFSQYRVLCCMSETHSYWHWSEWQPETAVDDQGLKSHGSSGAMCTSAGN